MMNGTAGILTTSGTKVRHSLGSKINRGGFKMKPSAHPSCNGDCLILSAGWLHKYPLFKNKCGNRFYFGRTLRDLARILITKSVRAIFTEPVKENGRQKPCR